MDLDESAVDGGGGESYYLPNVEPVDASTLAVGDVIAHRGLPRAEVLRPHEPWNGDLFGRPMRAYWCRALDGSDKEGWVPFGPGGVFPRELPAQS